MDEIFRITKDERRAKALKEMAKNRLANILSLKEPYRIIEEYYEIIKELLTAFMYLQVYKTLSHKLLIEYSAKNIKSLSPQEASLIDELRVKRNNIVYYGEQTSIDFLKSREPKIKEIISKLIKLI